jgi:DNA-binding response OmpR family regulator
VTILLVDDEEAVRVLITRRLVYEGFEVLAVESGREALDALRAQPIELVLLDLNMPEKDGLSTLGAIKSDPIIERVPVLMLTASSERESVVHCLSLGAADYVVKPVSPQELVKRVRRWLPKSDSAP